MGTAAGRAGRSIREAFAAVERTGFLPPSQRSSGTRDQALPIGYGQTNSQPTTVANMLALLGVEPGQRILDVGSGSGWSTALLAWLTGPEGRVIGVELVPQLVAVGSAALARHDFPWAEIMQAQPGVLGVPESGPYDRILVSAMATTVSGALVEQLVIGGVMVCPVAGRMLRLVRTGPDTHDITSHGRYVFVPLITDVSDDA